ncbi:hypothetical protein [Saccharothrix sp. HUAS TT10]|uniref:hypothetical protein n=1 Tax=Saccharothrix sp. HUAS TT10 TaxID=3447450 RepID=UPI003F722512
MSLLLVALWAVAQVPAALVGQARPVPDQTPPSVATALERCVQLMGATRFESFTAGPSMVRGRKVVLVARSESVALVCTVDGARTTTWHREIHHDKAVGSSGLVGDPPNGDWYVHGAVRADVAGLSIRTTSGHIVAARVSGGSFLVDLTGVREDELPYMRVHQALDARGAVLYEG